MVVQPNKAIVGANAFAHTSGIHQDGLLKEKTTYEIMRPESIGLVESKMVMGKLSGRHAFRQRLEELGYKLGEEEVNHAFERFKKLADQKKEIFEEDLEVIVSEELAKMAERIVLKAFQCRKRDGSGSDGHGRTGNRRQGRRNRPGPVMGRWMPCIAPSRP